MFISLYSSVNSNLTLKANTSDLADVARTTTENAFVGTQAISGNWIGPDSPALVISARTDQNTYSRPAIYFDCYGTVGASLFLDVDGTLKLKVGETTHTINMT